MKQLIMLQGPPGSGKTTWAKDLCYPGAGYVRINKDDLRLELLGVHKGDQRSKADVKRTEKDVILPARDARISNALNAGFNVVIDDVNIGGGHEGRLRYIATQHYAEFQIRRFDTPLEVCIERNAARPENERVPEEAIRRFHNEMGIVPTFAKVEPRTDLPHAVLCDLDGTLALFKGVGPNGQDLRSPYDGMLCAGDVLNVPVWATLMALQSASYAADFPSTQIIFLSARDEKWRPQTEEFLAKHGFGGFPLHMRTAGDMRKDWIIKGEIFDANIRGRYDVLYILDDRNQVVDFWRSIGLTCFQVAAGAF